MGILIAIGIICVASYCYFIDVNEFNVGNEVFVDYVKTTLFLFHSDVTTTIGRQIRIFQIGCDEREREKLSINAVICHHHTSTRERSHATE